MLAMVEEFGHDMSLLWDDDQSWAFPILAADGEENGGGKILIEDGKILTEIVNLDAEEAPPPAAVKGKRKQGRSHMQVTISDATARKKRSAGAAAEEGGGGDGGNNDGVESEEHELHIWTERERRKKMRNMFANLHALIPNIHPRADKSTIVDEAILYIKKLRLTLDNLEKLKRERNPSGGNANPTAGDASTVTQSREAFLAEQGSVQPAVTLASPGPMPPGPEPPAAFKTWTSPNVILNVCGRDAHINVCCPRKPGLLTAILFVMERYKLEVVSAQVSAERCTRMYMIHARANGGAHQFPEATFLVEEMYKQAAAEIMLWLNS